MRSPFVRFVVFSMAVAALLLGGYYVVSGRLNGGPSILREPSHDDAAREPSVTPPALDELPPLPSPVSGLQPTVPQGPIDVEPLPEVTAPHAVATHAALPPPTNEEDPAIAALQARHLRLPIANYREADLQDSFEQARGDHRHEAVDLMAPRGTPVLAVDSGNIAKLFRSRYGGMTVYQFDSARQYCYYYAHLDRYVDGLKEGMLLQAGDRIGSVGSTGDAAASAPHLHFAIFKLGPEKHWWEGTALNPYRVLKSIR